MVLVSFLYVINLRIWNHLIGENEMMSVEGEKVRERIRNSIIEGLTLILFEISLWYIYTKYS